MSNAKTLDVTNDVYHADKTSISHSGLDLVIEDPALYWWQKLSGRYVQEQAKHFDDGNDLDAALLRDCEHCGSEVVPIPLDVLSANGARAGGKWKAFEAANAGKVLVKEGEDLLEWVRAVQRHPAARGLLEADGHFQHTIHWHDDEFDVDRRARLDMLHLGSDVVVDLKTTRTAATLRECSNEVAKWGYHRQAAFYLDAVEELYATHPMFIFIFVSKKPPFRVETFELDDEFLEAGREQNARGLATYAECLRTGQWLPQSHGTITKLSPPGWVKWEKEWSYA